MSEYEVEVYEDAPHWFKVIIEGRKAVGEIISKPSADFWAEILNNETAELRQQLADVQKANKTLTHQLELSRKLYNLRVADLKAEHHYRRQIQAEHAQMKAALEAIAEHAPEATAAYAKTALNSLKPLEELDEVAEVVRLEQLEKFFAAIKAAPNMLAVQSIVAEYDPERQEHPLDWLMPKDAPAAPAPESETKPALPPLHIGDLVQAQREGDYYNETIGQVKAIHADGFDVVVDTHPEYGTPELGRYKREELELLCTDEEDPRNHWGEEIVPVTLEEVAQIEAEYRAHVAKQPKLLPEEIDWFAKHYVDHDEFRLMPDEGYVDWLDNKAVCFYTSLTKGKLYELREAYNTPANHAEIAKRRDELKGE